MLSFGAEGMQCHHLGRQTFEPTRPGHHQPLHGPCPRAHSHRICASRSLLSALSLLCCTGGNSQRASGTQLRERQGPAGSTCCAKELRKCCYSGEELAATRCEGWSPDVRGTSASHNWESCLPPQWRSCSVIPSFLSHLLLPKQSASSKLPLNSDKKGMITEHSNILCVNQSTSHYVMQWLPWCATHSSWEPAQPGCFGPSSHANLTFCLWKSLVVSLSTNAS